MASQLADVLRSQFCRTLTLPEAERIAHATVPRRIPPGSRISQPGDLNAGLIFLVRGTAEILKDTPHAGPQAVASVTGPTILGEISLLTGEASSSTVRALTPCECYILTRAQYQRLLETDSLETYKLIAAIAELLARKLTAMNDRVAAPPRP